MGVLVGWWRVVDSNTMLVGSFGVNLGQFLLLSRVVLLRAGLVLFRCAGWYLPVCWVVLLMLLLPAACCLLSAA